MVRLVYHYPTSEEILQYFLPKTENGTDKLLWRHLATGAYQVKKAYDLLQKDLSNKVTHEQRVPSFPKNVWETI